MIGKPNYLEQFYSSVEAICKVSNKTKLAKSAFTAEWLYSSKTTPNNKLGIIWKKTVIYKEIYLAIHMQEQGGCC